MTWLRRTCEEHQRLWLLRADGDTAPAKGRGAAGWLASRANDRHLAECADCRRFAASAVEVARRTAGAGDIAPPAELVRTIGRLAAEALPGPAAAGWRGETEQSSLRLDAEQSHLRWDAEQRWWAGAFMGGAILAAAAGLVLAFLRPAAFSGHPTPPSRLESRLAWAQQEMDQVEAEVPVGTGRMSFDDRIQSTEQQLRCLEVDLEDVNWNTLKQDSACTDS